MINILLEILASFCCGRIEIIAEFLFSLNAFYRNETYFLHFFYLAVTF